MPIQYVCLGCREEMVLPDHKAGQLCACPRCRLKFLAPPPSARPAAPRGGPPVYPGAAARPVRLVQPPAPAAAPEPEAIEEEATDPAPGLFGMAAGTVSRGGLFGQEEVEVGELFGGAGDDPAEAPPAAAQPRPAPAPAPRPASAPPGAAPGQGGPPAGAPPPGYRPPHAYGYPAPGYGAPPPQGYPPHGYPPPGYGAPPQGYPQGYPGYPGHGGYPGYPPPGAGYPGYPPPGAGYPGYPGYGPPPGAHAPPPGAHAPPTPAAGVPLGPPPADTPAEPTPDLISMDDLVARRAPSAAVGGRGGCRLVCLDGLPDGTEFHLPAGKIYDIGRDKEADVKILSTSVSRRQARIDATGQQPVLIDCGSANGTQVNGEVVARHPLREGDLIKMGKVLFRFQSA